MTDFDPLDDFAEDFGAPLSPAEKERVRDRLMRLNEDPVRIDVGDREVVDFTERQFGRIIGDDGQPVRKDFERFRPSVGPNDLFLFGSVGDDADNAPEDVFKVKKLLQRAAGAEFRPGLEGLGEADPSMVNTLRNIQGTNNLKVDGRIEPGGPTLHALGFRALGPEDGRPTPLAAHEFEARFGKPADRDERGELLLRSDRVEAPRFQLAAKKRGGGSGRGPNPPNRPPKSKIPNVRRDKRKEQQDESFRRHMKEQKEWLENKEGTLMRPDIPRTWSHSKSPAVIFRYPDGRVYLAVDPFGRIHEGNKFGPPAFIKLKPSKPTMLRGFQKHNRNLPDFDELQIEDRDRSQAGTTPGHVFGPTFDEKGNQIGWKTLLDPRTRPGLISLPPNVPRGQPRFLRTSNGKPVYLSLEEIKRLGLWRWYSPNLDVVSGEIIKKKKQ